MLAAVITYGAGRVAGGYTTAGELIGFIIAMGLVQMPIKKLNNAYLKLKIAEAGCFRVYGLLEELDKIEVELDAPAVAHQSGLRCEDYQGNPLRVRDGIRFEKATLDYDGKIAFKDITFEAKAGEVVALVGESGSGKTSLVNAIARLYETTGGRICIDGKDIREIPLIALRRAVSIVTQETFLFNDSIYENIKMGKPQASDEEILRAAKLAHCDEFISRCHLGIQTFIGDRGMSLSGGERQRVAIARAMLKGSPILILDEATSSLDSRSEALVQDALEELMENKTTFVVAHRLATVKHASQILVLDQGRLVERGTHRELLNLDGAYRSLYHRQFGGEVESWQPSPPLG